MYKNLIYSIVCVFIMSVLTGCAAKDDEAVITDNNIQGAVSGSTTDSISYDSDDNDTVDNNSDTSDPAANDKSDEGSIDDGAGDESSIKHNVVSYDIDELKSLFNDCIAGTDDNYIYKAAYRVLDYAASHKLSEQFDESIDNLNSSVKAAYDSLSKADKKTFIYNMREEIMPIISDSYTEPDLYEAEMDEVGVKDAWLSYVKDKRVKNDFSVLWGAIDGL